ncbi:MAG: alkaline phosphatase family protein [Candidatus Syntropharchaeia archaeon]
MNISEKILPELRKEDGNIFPDYSRFCISNTAPSISEFLGMRLGRGKPLQRINIIKKALKKENFLKNYENILLLFIDSFSTHMMDHLAKFLPERNVRGILTSTFPSVTPTCLASMMTGLPPISHGIVGFNVFFEGDIINVFKLTSVLDGRRLPIEYGKVFFDFRDIFSFCREEGIDTRMILPKEIVESETTRALGEEVPIEGYSTFEEMFIKIERGHGFAYAYVSVFDEIVHELGTTHRKIMKTLSEMAKAFRRFSTREKTLVFIVSDHFHIDLNTTVSLDIPGYRHPPAVSGGRIAYLYTENLDENLFEDRIILLESEKGIKMGLWGKGKKSERFRERVGDFTVIAKKDTFLSYPYRKVEKHRASHGALTEKEMLVPFCLFEL